MLALNTPDTFGIVVLQKSSSAFVSGVISFFFFLERVRLAETMFNAAVVFLQIAQASQQTQLSFFNLFYWCVNFGSFLGLGIVAYIQQQEDFRMGFIVCAVSLGCSAVAFVAGKYMFVII